MEKIRIAPSSIILTLSLIIILILAYFINQLLLISLVGIGIGVLLTPIIRILHTKLYIPEGLSAVLMVILLLLLFSILFGSIYYLVSDQVEDLTKTAPELYESMNRWVQGIFNDRPWLKGQLQKFEVGNTFRTSVINLFKGFRSGVMVIALFVYSLVIGFYTAVYSETYFKKAVEAFPLRHREKAQSILLECASVLRGWFKAQLLDMIIVGVLTALGLWIVGVRYWAVFGLLTAAFGIIPYVGIMLVVTISALITLASDPSQVIWVLIVFGVTEQLEGHVIIPMVMKGKVKLPVVPLLIFMLIMATLYGILGVFVAPAIFAILRVIYIRIYLDKLENGPTLIN